MSNGNGTNGGGNPLVIISYSKKDAVWKDDYLLPHLKALELVFRSKQRIPNRRI